MINNNNLNYFKKYIKYKKKYFGLIKIIGGSFDLPQDLNGIFNRLITVHNTGSIPGGRYFNQCIFISIRDYLNRNGHPDLTLEELRYQAGLAGIMETQEWDQDKEIHVLALRNLSEIYDLDINIWNIGSNGLLDTRYLIANNSILIPRYREGDGRRNVINIASYGRHFELIIGGGIFETAANLGEFPNNDNKIGEYQAYVLKDNEYVKLDSLSFIDRLEEDTKNEIDSLHKIKLMIIEDITNDEEQKVLKDKKTDTLDEKDFSDFLSGLNKAIESQVKSFDMKIKVLNKIIQKIQILKRIQKRIKNINDKEKDDKELRLVLSRMNLSEEEIKLNSYKKFKSIDNQVKIDKLNKRAKLLEEEIKELSDSIKGIDTKKLTKKKKKKKSKRIKKKSNKKNKKKDK